MQGQPKAIFIYFRMKDVDRRIEAIAQVNVESKEEKVERAEFNVPTCENCFFLNDQRYVFDGTPYEAA